MLTSDGPLTGSFVPKGVLIVPNRPEHIVLYGSKIENQLLGSQSSFNCLQCRYESTFTEELLTECKRATSRKLSNHFIDDL